MIQEAWRLEPIIEALHRRDFAEAEDQRQRNRAGFAEWVYEQEKYKTDSEKLVRIARIRAIVDMLDRIALLIAVRNAPVAISEIESIIFVRRDDETKRAYHLSQKPFRQKSIESTTDDISSQPPGA